MKQELIYRKLIDTGLMDKDELRFCIEQFRVNPVFNKYNNLFQVIEAIGYLTRDQINKIITELKEELQFKDDESENTKKNRIYKAVHEPVEKYLPVNYDERNNRNSQNNAENSGFRDSESESKPSVRSLDNILHAGDILRGCRLVKKIGVGSMGQVWLGEHLSLKVDVAIKILHEEFYSNHTLLERFYREAHQVAKLDHQNIVRVYDVASDKNLHLIIMQYIDGPSLAELEKTKTISFEYALNYTMQTLSGLDYAQKKGIIHRDIKLENLMLTSDAIVKITDFGFGKETKGANVLSINRLTIEGDVFGTPFYMPPEQWDDARSVGPQSDVYSTGIALFKMLTGRFPVEGETAFQIISKIMSGKKSKIRDFMPDIDKDLEHIIEKAVHLNLDQRYQTPFDFGIRLSKYCIKNKLYHTIPSEFLRVTALRITKHFKHSTQALPTTNQNVNIQSKCFELKKVSEIPDALVLKCSMKWDLQRLIEFENLVEKIIINKSWKYLLIDMSEVNKINSTTLSSLIRMNEKFNDSMGGEIAIYNPTKQLQIILQIMSFNNSLSVLKTVEEAKKYFSK